MANSAPNIHDFIGNADELIGFNSISDFTGSLKNVQFESKSREEWENFRNKIRAILTMMALHVDDDYRSHHFTSCMDLQDDTHRFGDLTAEGILLSIFQTHCAGKAAKSIQSTIEDIHLGAYDKLCTVYSILDATNSGSAQGTIAADKLNTAKRQRDQSIQDFNKDYFNLYEEYERQGRSKDVQTCIQDYCNAVIGNEKQYSEIILNTIQNWTEAVQRAAHSNLQQAQTALQEVIERRWKDGVIPITQAQSIGFSAQQQSTKNYNRNQNFNNNSRVKACSHCGKQGCRPGPQCQAQGKICKGCGKLNHFKDVADFINNRATAPVTTNVIQELHTKVEIIVASHNSNVYNNHDGIINNNSRICNSNNHGGKDIKLHFLREELVACRLRIFKIATDKQPGDMHTKALNKDQLKQLLHNIMDPVTLHRIVNECMDSAPAIQRIHPYAVFDHDMEY
eukprot:CAMPEP_0204821862 /NCGR_PEP_ID=MMETSP1346-20131115/65_1 /ASSEMBLY_ACC=CAM_ASM_000771 /TAXON_ID=215587 /ORGANISM="Aplanochytrium stocchinoi, Strain GSBS06" /LENGTH=451 /DNA_ID=CAMNT_0051947807 /DNA_START=60 /DNA_END=1416 /DNA_ORIENTATION=+